MTDSIWCGWCDDDRTTIADNHTERRVPTRDAGALWTVLSPGAVILHAWMQAVGMANESAPVCFRRAEVRAPA